MKSGDSLKHYISYFQNQMALVYNYNDDVVTAAFISELQVSHSYKYLVKHEVTRMGHPLLSSKIHAYRECYLGRNQSLSQTRE